MYIIEGTIGAGKSTLLRLIAAHIPTFAIIDEPVNNWQSHLYGQSLLTNFYEQPQRWAYTFELLTLMARIKEHRDALVGDNQTQLVERSIYSGFYCFAKNSFEQQFMSRLEWELYQEWFSFLLTPDLIPKGFIYLRVAPEIAYERIKKRNRHAEKTLSLTYLKQINAKHEQFLIDKEGLLPALREVPVLVIDCNEEFEENEYQLHEHLKNLSHFCKSSYGKRESIASSFVIE
jgi:deoxyadenosine/deoxycytidine kinase